MENNIDLHEFSRAMSRVKLPKWDDLPDFPIYCDQMLQIMTEKIACMQSGDEKHITKSMVNNYVKWGMMPKPVKKKYEKIHVVYIIVITLLKQILPITKIKDGIQLQIALLGDEKAAYDSFCEAFEESMQRVFLPVRESNSPYILEAREIKYEKLAVSTITTALANKWLTEKIIETKLAAYHQRQREGEQHGRE